MKLLSLNVNGIRSAVQKGLLSFIEENDYDVLCFQEVKALREQLSFSFPNDYYLYWNAAQKKGYSGTLVLSREKAIDANFGIPSFDENKEGRVITLEFEKYFLVCVYTPNSKDGLLRLDYRIEWDEAFCDYLKQLKQIKDVICCGDFNVAHENIDLKNPEQNRRNAGFTDEERLGFTNLLNAGFKDTFRELYPQRVEYSWFSYRTKAKSRNAGWRIDYFIVSNSLMKNVEDANILFEYSFSDHVPVTVDIKF